jgi:hypothetical protein
MPAGRHRPRTGTCRLAEYGDGKPPRFRAYGPEWIAMALVLNWIIQVVVRR